MICKEGKYWVDKKYDNKWSLNIGKEEAERLSKTLDNCTRCINCEDCTDCIDCNNCRDCYKCYTCNYCTSCEFCDNCTCCKNCDNCYQCEHCYDCALCGRCFSCIKCKYCHVCEDCKNYISNPQRYTIKSTGNKESSTTIYWVDDNIQASSKFFMGSFEEWANYVKTTFKDEQLEAYLKQINIIENLIKMNKEIYENVKRI